MTSLHTPESLAIHGGSPVRDPARPWPVWPQHSASTKRNLLRVLESGRWSLSGATRESQLFERTFAHEFAAYTATRYCVPVDHGSSALVVALEALRLNFGDRVLVPALTWTASATAAFRAGLVPVLVDVCPTTGCLAPESVAEIGEAVEARAVVAVHWACAMADIPALRRVAEPLGMDVIEDCAQAHGAAWAGRPAGSLSRIGAFSMQQSKVLTAGEGGAVVTDEPGMFHTLQELRADSRSYRSGVPRPGESDLAETAGIMGSNFVLSEWAAAVLCAQLPELDRQHEVREANHRRLTANLAMIPGVDVHQPAAAQTRMSIYEVPIKFEEMPQGMPAQDVADALTAELGVAFYLGDVPLHRSILLQPWSKPTLDPLAREFERLNAGRRFPVADAYCDRTVVTHHSTLLGDASDMDDIAAAVTKLMATT